MASAALNARITLDDEPFLRSIRRVQNKSHDAARALSRSFIGVGSNVLKLTGLVGGLTTAIAGVGASAAIFRTLRSAISSASEMEDLRINMEAFLGSTEKANALIDEMTQFATRTPFETEDLLETSKILAGAGIQENLAQVAKELAAVSKNGQQLRELGDALAKGFAKGKFQTEEVNKFLERGINLMPQFERVTGLSGEALSKAIQKGLNFEQVTEAIRGMSAEGGQFYGLLERRSKTTDGLISTLISNWQEFKRELGEPIADAIKPGLDLLTEKLQQGKGLATEIGEQLADGVSLFIEAWRTDMLSDLIASTIKVGFLKGVQAGREILIEGLSSTIERLLNPFGAGTTAAVQLKANLAAAGQLTPEREAAINRAAGGGGAGPRGLDLRLAEEQQNMSAIVEALRASIEARSITQTAPQAKQQAAQTKDAISNSFGREMVEEMRQINRKLEE